MRFLMVCAGLLLVGVMAGCGGSGPQVTDIDGQAFDLSQLRGRWLVVTYWAEWCPSCRYEISDFNRLYREHKDRVMVFGVNFDGKPPQKLKSIAKKLNIHYPILSDFPLENYTKQPIQGIPVTFIISPEGKLVRRLPREQTKSKLERVMGLKHG